MLDKLTDEELIVLIYKGDEYAEAVFYDRYYKKSQIVGHLYRIKYNGINISEDEYVSVAYSSVVIALKRYNTIKGLFYSYWVATVKNEINGYMRNNNNISNQKNTISLDENCYENNDRTLYHETLSSKDEDDEETLEDVIRKFIYSPTSNLSDDEALVAHFLFYRQYGYEEIMKRTGWKRDKTFYVIRNTRKKISDYLKSAYFN